MSSGALPDEIIKEILTPALRVPDERFRNTDAVSPFLTCTESSSAFLLVCKSWLRVATPLLYHVVVLRSKPQARALERALRGNETLAVFIKKLRIEGGFGASMYHILRLGKNIQEIWLKLNLWSSDSVTGLCNGLPLTNPRRLIFPDENTNDNAPTRKLVNTVCECIPKWERLSAIDLPFHGTNLWRSFAQSSLLEALPQAKSLKTITLTEPQCDKNMLLTLAQNSSLEAMHVLAAAKPNFRSSSLCSWTRSRIQEIMADERLGKILHYDSMDGDDDMDVTVEFIHKPSPSKEDLITFDPSFVALQSVAEEVKTKIWSNIIYFSLLQNHTRLPPTERDRRRVQSSFSCETSPDTEYIPKVPKTNILLVSKLFFNTAMRHYYRYLLLDGLMDLMRVGSRVSDNPHFGPAIHHLATCSCWGGIPDCLHPFLMNATSLVHLTSGDSHEALLDYQSLVTLAAKAGTTLQTLTGHAIVRASSPKSPTPLYAFTALRALDWDSSLRLKFKQQEVPLDALPCLEWLNCISSNDTFLELLRCMTLPKLKHVTFPMAKKMEGAHKFLRKHGPKLYSLGMENLKGCWAFCPSLSVVTMFGLPVFEPHTKVKTIILSISGFREGAVGDKFQRLGTIDCGKDFPALHEIRVTFCHWPTTERDICRGPRSNWVKWSERLMEWNVKLTDKNGKHWKPRLK